jgi:hypothetical protein
MVKPEDLERYDNLTSNVLKAQGLLMIFTVFWARLYELGNFKMPI